MRTHCTSPAASQLCWVLSSHREQLHLAPSFQPHAPCALFKLQDLFAGDLNSKSFMCTRKKLGHGHRDKWFWSTLASGSLCQQPMLCYFLGDTVNCKTTVTVFPSSLANVCPRMGVCSPCTAQRFPKFWSPHSLFLRCFARSKEMDARFH